MAPVSQPRMIRKLIRELFGHYATPAEAIMLVPKVTTSSRKGAMIVFLPEGKQLNYSSVDPTEKLRPALAPEMEDMQWFYSSTIRIDQALSVYTHIATDLESDHVRFGNYTSVPDNNTL